MAGSDPFGGERWLGALALLATGFALLALALLFDARCTPNPYPATPAPVHYGNE